MVIETLARLSVRDGPGAHYMCLSILPRSTFLSVVGEQGAWLQVKHEGAVGWVHRDFVKSSEMLVDTGFLKDDTGLLAHVLPACEPLPLLGAGRARRAIQVWNKYGSLLEAVSDKLSIDPLLSAAVMSVESCGSGFINGKMMIRFELHQFYKRWGVENKEVFNQHYRCGKNKRWQGHLWRKNTGEDCWQRFHGNQRHEWEVCRHACEYNEEAAKASLSMGLAKMMGFNHGLIGYESSVEMFAALSSTIHAQILSFFDFIQGPDSQSRMLKSLQDMQLETFTRFYNGQGQVIDYALWVEQAYEGLLRSVTAR